MPPRRKARGAAKAKSKAVVSEAQDSKAQGAPPVLTEEQQTILEACYEDVRQGEISDSRHCPRIGATAHNDECAVSVTAVVCVTALATYALGSAAGTSESNHHFKVTLRGRLTCRMCVMQETSACSVT
jgi:hypothetical protein